MLTKFLKMLIVSNYLALILFKILGFLMLMKPAGLVNRMNIQSNAFNTWTRVKSVAFISITGFSGHY